MMSPGWMPASAAGLGVSTLHDNHTTGAVDFPAAARFSGVRVAGRIPIYAWRGGSRWPAAGRRRRRRVAAGIAKTQGYRTPRSAECRPPLIPTNLSLAHRVPHPPELPGEMAASVWIRSTSGAPVEADPGIWRCSPEMMPDVTVALEFPAGCP